MLLHEAFIHAARRRPRDTFIVDGVSGREMSFGRALLSALALSRRLRYDPASDRSRRLGVMLPNSDGAILTVLASLIAGRTPVMINYATGAERNAAFAMKRCDLSTVVTSGRLLDRLGCSRLDGMVDVEDLARGVGLLERAQAATLAVLPRWAAGPAAARAREDDPAVIAFTSGSEGTPKPVVLSHRNIMFEVDAVSDAFDVRPDDAVLANLPFFHVYGLTVDLFLPAVRGLKIVTHPSPLDFSAITKSIRERGVTVVAATPAFWWGYMRASRRGDFKDVRVAVVGADRCPETLRLECLEQHGVALLEGYGATETSPVVAVNTAEAHRPGSVGRPLAGVEVRIERTDTGEMCAPGESGRILVRGPLVMKEYLHDREATARAVRAGWYDTGDLGYLDDDGFLWLTGRLTRCVKVGGETVSLWRVESVLNSLLPRGVECCVVDLPDDRRGAAIVAVVTGDVDARETARRMAEELPRIAVPKAFVRVDSLPTLSSSKTDFRAVRELAAHHVEGNA